MKRFKPVEFHPEVARRELAEFRQLLDRPRLSEARELLPFFRQREQLIALMGHYNSRIQKRDRVAVEFDLFGDFRADFAVGDSRKHQYCFVEFEDATERSVFRHGGHRTMPQWSGRFERGCSQVIDWMYWLESQKHTPSYVQRFGSGEIHHSAVLVIGRDRDLADPLLRHRLTWRSEHVVICSRKLHCITFDELLLDLETWLDTLHPR